MSGSCWYYGEYGDFRTQENVDFIEKLVEEKNLDERSYFIYFTTGTQDSVKSQSLWQAEEMLRRGDVFTLDHFVFYQKEGGFHDFDAVQEYMYNVLPLFFRDGAETSEAPEAAGFAACTVDTPVSEVMNDPAFGEYGQLIFPVDRSCWSGNTLGDLDYVWYNYIDSDKTVEITNYMKRHALAGDTIFYDI